MTFLLRDRRDTPSLLRATAAAVALAWLQHPVVVAVSTWWIGNTVAHHAVHRRLFRGRGAEAAFAVVLTLLLGVPQELWRVVHLAHHAERPVPWRRCRPVPLLIQAMALGGLHVALAVGCLPLGWSSYAAGLAVGLLLSFLHGCYEHRGGITDQPDRW
ncbi:MAG: fatty acid desaturase, partial [Planctomycetes bacterium]|nr:fatty acid desaturase [Planctomycetota bacterium]